MAGPSFHEGRAGGLSAAERRGRPTTPDAATADKATPRLRRVSENMLSFTLMHSRACAPGLGRQSLVLGPWVICRITWSMPKLAAFIRGGNSTKLCSHCPMYACAGTSMKARSIRQRA